ncbi:MAG: D-alanine--D-alanine ligase, partial [Planctomycetes bacterium]|nr:D-alanine--D-alanine ligase [Planctomycetota bacterium]
VGSGVAASAVSIDKVRTRECFVQAGIPVPRGCTGELPLGTDEIAREVARVEAKVGYPSFAKVDCSGSSIGVRALAGRPDLVAFFEESRGCGRRYLAEVAVTGDEVSVPVLGNSGETLRSLPPVGIYPVHDGYFTFDAKYTPAACEEVVPPRGWGADECAAVEELAVRCHEVLRCDGMSRTDMIVGRDGPVVLETNTIPGFTAESLFPKSAAHVGISFRELVDRFFEAAARRWGVAL